MKALTRLAISAEDRTVFVDAGEEIPDALLEFVDPSLVEGEEIEGEDPEGFGPEFAELKTVEQVLAWVDGGVDDAAQEARAVFAHAQETEAGQRATLLKGLEDRLMALRG